MKKQVILASGSPRRKELLGLIFDEFDIIVSDVEEIVSDDIPLEQQPEYLSKIKCSAVASDYPNALVIGADTSVFADGKVLGKPKNKDDAFDMLKMLSGRFHEVITGVTVMCEDVCKSFSVVTRVEFYKLSDSEINAYIETSEPYDKAGGYGIQSLGGLFVKGIIGDYNNVVGLPVAELNRIINTYFI